MNEFAGICLKSEQFIRRFLKVYLEDRDFDAVISMFHKNITWFGARVQEMCSCYEDALRLLAEERSSGNERFQITGQSHHSLPLGETRCLVHGEADIAQAGEGVHLLSMKIRFTFVCVREEGEMKLLHCHFSAPYTEQEEVELLHKKILEQLTRNIYGGVQLCRFDADFTVKYVSEGFTAMTGYTKKEMDALFGGKHTNIVYQADVPMFTKEIVRQLKANHNFSVEYRIVCKDGQIIWVMDKGVSLLSTDGETDIQCILTDITARKAQEEALRLSEKRYEIALRASGVTMFEYNVQNGDLILISDTAKSYVVPEVIKDGARTFIEKGIIEPVSALDYQEMYRQIHAGAPTAKCYVKAKDAGGTIHDYELSLTNLFDSDGKPVRAIGVRKNVSEIMLLQKEQNFGKSFVSGMELVFEADLSNDRMEYIYKKEGNEMMLTEDSSFAQMYEKIVMNLVVPEQRQMMLEKVSMKYLREALANKESLITFSYKRKISGNTCEWHEATISIIKDQVTGDIRIRFYHRNINDIKVMEQKAMEEKRLYESMIAKASLAYEVNITKNLAIKGHEYWGDLFGIEKSDNYELMISEFAKKGIHLEEGKDFYEAFNQSHVIEQFAQGERQISCSYRKKETDGDYHWVSCTLHLYEDPESNDIKGFSYVEDIDEEKRRELELRYNAEHDAMTAIYNKITAEQRMDEYLRTAEGIAGSHAFFIIDIDHFKNVNDTFGHPFGDEVLKEVAGKIRKVFREQDVVGRMGGDEFCVFMKHSNTREAAERKAEEICKKVQRTYEKGEKACSISASIGIAFYREDGTNYKELYKYADRSLYRAKRHGRNRYEM